MKLKQKLLLVIIAPILISFIVLTVLLYTFTNNMLVENGREIMLKSAEKNGANISKIIKEDIVKMESVTSQIAKLNLDDKKEIDTVITDLSKSIERFETLFIGYPDKTFIYPYDSVPDDYDCTTRTWYKETMQAGKMLLSEPYLRTDGVAVITVTSPVIQNGNIQAILGVDVDLNEIKDFTKNVKLYKSGNGVVLHEKGYFLAHDKFKATDNVYDVEGGKYKKLGTQIFGQNTSFFERGNYFYTKSKIADTDWLFVIRVPKKEVESQSRKLLWLMFVATIVLLVLITTAVYITAHRTTQPIILATKALDKLANYNLNLDEEKVEAVKYMDVKNEVGIMIRSIDTMVYNLKSIVVNISEHASNTAATAEELTATAQNTNESANEVAKAVGNIAEGATGQAHDTTVAAQSIEENSQALTDMIKLLGELKEVTTDIDSKKNEGKNSIDDLARLSDKSKGEASFVNRIIVETNESAENISKASEMIQSIADQTNLLALNVAIELAVVM